MEVEVDSIHLLHIHLLTVVQLMQMGQVLLHVDLHIVEYLGHRILRINTLI